ncbi:MAG: hypothetical protein DRP45_03860 [Candidatus Zixiibacteriota bacterium]|nr:MAG: hypothetical protein DRP45_03860 [candidate division Zixibacteria bacterium]
MREIAAMNESKFILPGYRELDRKRIMLRRQADRYETCGLEYAVIGCKDCKRSFLGPRRCESRICETCARKYSARIRQRQQQIVHSLQPTKRKRLAMLTLTKKSHPRYRPTSSDVRELFRNARKLINHFWPKRLGCGAFAVMEIGANWNLHIHVLLYGHYVPQSRISEYWNKLTGDSPVIDIRSIKKPGQAVNYLLKYITKPKKFNDPKETAHYVNLLLGVRRIHSYGIFYGQGLLPKTGCPCPLCGGKLQLQKFDPGPMMPETARFFAEVFKMEDSPGAIN